MHVGIGTWCIVRLHLHCIVQVTQFRIFPPMWHRSDIAYDCVNSKNSHGFQANSYVEINQIWIGYVHLHLLCKWKHRIFPCKCDSFVIENLVFLNISRYKHTCNKWNISSWVAEYSFCSFVLNKRRSDADVLLLKSRWVLVAAVVSDDGSCTDERFSSVRLVETTK